MSDEYLQSVNKLQVTELIYTGQCPGKKLESEKVVFFSKNTPTAEDRRVIVRNVTGSENNEVNLDLQPYTDREYQEEESSEKIKISLGEKHDGGKLIVFEGNNQFTYEIVDVEEQGDEELETIIEEGSFSADVEKITEYEERDARELYTPEDDDDDDDGDDINININTDDDTVPDNAICPFD